MPRPNPKKWHKSILVLDRETGETHIFQLTSPIGAVRKAYIQKHHKSPPEIQVIGDRIKCGEMATKNTQNLEAIAALEN